MLRVRIAWLTTLAVIGSTAAFAVAASGQEVNPGTLTVEKVIVGSHPNDNEYTVRVDCGEQTDVTFDANGDPDPAGSNVLVVPLNTVCTVTETDDGGATTVSYACEVTSEAALADCHSDNEVGFSDEAGGAATVTVTNTFEEPTTTTTTTTTPPTTTTPAVVAQPRFTG